MLRRLIFNETMYFGVNSHFSACTEIRRRAFTRALFVVDPALVDKREVRGLQKALTDRGVKVTFFSDFSPNPSVACVKKGVKVCKKAKAACIVAIGGGSTLDTAKAVSLIARNPKYSDVLSLEGDTHTEHRALPVLALPTTAGSGSEANMNFVLTDEEKQRKFVCSDPNAIPTVVVIDPQLMASMPAALIASTGMDALTHAIEAYLTRGAWLLTDTLNEKAMQLISSSLRKAVRHDLAALGNVALGQYITGMTFANVGLGLAHAMAHALGGLYDMQHGLATAMLLPFVLGFNAPAVGMKYRGIARAMGVAGVDAMPPEMAAKAAIHAVRQLAADIAIPSRLQLLEVQPGDLPLLAEMAATDMCIQGNPRPCGKNLILEVYKAAY